MIIIHELLGDILTLRVNATTGIFWFIGWQQGQAPLAPPKATTARATTKRQLVQLPQLLTYS